jgi:hypothetical protein
MTSVREISDFELNVKELFGMKSEFPVAAD